MLIKLLTLGVLTTLLDKPFNSWVYTSNLSPDLPCQSNNPFDKKNQKSKGYTKTQENETAEEINFGQTPDFCSSVLVIAQGTFGHTWLMHFKPAVKKTRFPPTHQPNADLIVRKTLYILKSLPMSTCNLYYL